ncbi:MAG: hypothetical protein IIX00_03400, partial [Tidjanibacter sp.]|nr:hypothetical protein [Tidjanibacter sp.]
DAKLGKLGEDLCLFIQDKGLWGALDLYSGTELLPCRFAHAEPLSARIRRTNRQNICATKSA